MDSPSANDDLEKRLKSKRLKKRGVVATVVLMTVVFHVVCALIAGAIMIVHELVEEAEDFEEPPVIAAPQKRPEYQVNIQKLKKQSSPPRPRPIVVHNPNNINLPALDVPNIDTNIAITGRGSGGFGVGVSGGSGPPKFDVNVEFFGMKGGGKHIAFLLDYSASMGSGYRDQVKRRELIRTIGELPNGTKVVVIAFAGMAWDVFDEMTPLSKDWVRLNKAPKNDKKDKKSKDDKNVLPGWYPSSLKKAGSAKWVELKDSTRKKLNERILATPLILGTQFETSFFIACQMDPLPETIFFMTDGGTSTRHGIVPIEKMIAEIKRLHGSKAIPLINTIGLEVVSKTNYYSLTREQKKALDAKEKKNMENMDSKEKRAYEKELDEKREKEKEWWDKNKGKKFTPEDSSAGRHLINIAKLGKGQATFIEGIDYIEEHGEDRKVDWKKQRTMWDSKKCEWKELAPGHKTAEIYTEFSLLEAMKAKKREAAKK